MTVRHTLWFLFTFMPVSIRIKTSEITTESRPALPARNMEVTAMPIDLNKIPKLGFGLMRLPQKHGEICMDEVCRMVDAYLGAGMNYFDTAYVYHGGRSEKVVKEAIVDRYPRESFTLATKLPSWEMKGAEDADRIFNEQLERTGAGYFDFYLLHSIEEGSIDRFESFDCFNWGIRKKAEGKIRHFGCSFHGSPELLRSEERRVGKECRSRWSPYH